jgi:hypothetical protein
MAIASIAGGAMAGMGKKGPTPSSQQTGYKALPKEVRDLLLGGLGINEMTGGQGGDYLTRATNTAFGPMRVGPMARVEDTGIDEFDRPSSEMLKLQQYSDAVGGLFTPNTPQIDMRTVRQEGR